MKKVSVLIGFALFYFIVSAFMKTAPQTDQLDPKDFRSWKHVKTTIVDKPGAANEKYNGFHHIYANEVAMAGYGSGKFADGSIIVFEVVQADAENNVTKEGKRKFLDVMLKDRKKYSATGGWGYKEFMEENVNLDALKESDKVTCYNCHTSQKERDFVFSKWRE
jgi:hypothetical protein